MLTYFWLFIMTIYKFGKIHYHLWRNVHLQHVILAQYSLVLLHWHWICNLSEMVFRHDMNKAINAGTILEDFAGELFTPKLTELDLLATDLLYHITISIVCFRWTLIEHYRTHTVIIQNFVNDWPRPVWKDCFHTSYKTSPYLTMLHILSILL